MLRNYLQAEIQRMRLELSRLAQERDSYKQKCDAVHRSHQHQQQHQPKSGQQQQQNRTPNNSQMNDGSANYYL